MILISYAGRFEYSSKVRIYKYLLFFVKLHFPLLNILPAIPSFLILCNSPFLQTESNAFSRSTKQVCSFLFCVIYLFTIVLSINIRGL